MMRAVVTRLPTALLRELFDACALRADPREDADREIVFMELERRGEGYSCALGVNRWVTDAHARSL